MSEADDGMIRQVQGDVIDSEKLAVLSGAEDPRMRRGAIRSTGPGNAPPPASTIGLAVNHPHQAGDQMSGDRMGGQQLAPPGRRPGPSSAHGLVQPACLGTQNGAQLLARRGQARLGLGDALAVLGLAGRRQGLAEPPVGVGQADGHLGVQTPEELAFPVGQVQQAVVGEPDGRDAAIAEFGGTPAALGGGSVGQRPGEVPHPGKPVARGHGEHHLQGLRRPVGGDGGQHRLGLGPPGGVAPHGRPGIGGESGAVHPHGEGEQALGLQALALLRLPIAGDPGSHDDGAQLAGVAGLEQVEVGGDCAAPIGVLQVVGQEDPALHGAGVQDGSVGQPHDR